MPFLAHSFGQKLLMGMVAFLAASAVYLYGFPQQNVFYAVVVLLHLAAGVAATIVLLPLLGRLIREGTWLSPGGWPLFLAGAGVCCWLVRTAAVRSERMWITSARLECPSAYRVMIGEVAGGAV